MHLKTSVLVRAERLSRPKQWAKIFNEARRYFLGVGLPLPPLPPRVTGWDGCTFLITEIRDANGTRLGVVEIKDVDGRVRFRDEWTIAKGGS